jgi:hypothetical protein
MNEKVRKTLVYISLPLAIVWGAYNLSRPRTGPEVKRPETIQPISPKSVPSAVGALVDTERISRAPWGRDPFAARKADRKALAKDPTWVVTGIMYNSISPIAYVNREMVREGDTIKNARVLKIDKKTVTLEYRGNQFKISVLEG